MNCPMCGTLNRAGARFCLGCGRPLPVAPPASPPPAVTPAPQAGRRQAAQTIGLVALGLFGLILLLGLTVLALRKPAAVSSLPPGLPAPREAGQKGLDYLLQSAVQWQRANRCYGCHVQSFAVMGAGVSKKNAYQVDAGATGELADYLVSIQHAEGYIAKSEGETGHPAIQTAMAGVGLAQYDEHVDDRHAAAIVKMADWLVGQQTADGYWKIDHVEAPVDQGEAMVTGSALSTLATARQHEPKTAYDEAIEEGSAWLRQVADGTTQDLVFALVGLKAAGAKDKDADVERLVELLRRRQNADGGWGETTALGSNGYATGQALYAYKLAGVPIRDESFQQGAVWLLEHQEADGFWRQVNSQQQNSGRASNYATTMWAVIGLGEVFDERTEKEFLSLIHPTREALRPLAAFLFYLLPALLLAVGWVRKQRREEAARRDRSGGRGER